MKAKTYLKIIFGCILGEILVSIVLVLLAIATFISFVWYAITSTLFLIFHPIRFFTEEKKESEPFIKFVGNKFMNGFKKGFYNNDKEQIQKNNAYSKNNVQIGNINIKGE